MEEWRHGCGRGRLGQGGGVPGVMLLALDVVGWVYIDESGVMVSMSACMSCQPRRSLYMETSVAPAALLASQRMGRILAQGADALMWLDASL